MSGDKYDQLDALDQVNMQLKTEIDRLREENAQWKELNARSTAMVIPGETDSADAYRIMYFRMKAAVAAARESIEVMANKGTRAATVLLRDALAALDSDKGRE